MAIILPSGFNILNNEPVDARITLADESTRYALSSANVYEGLIIFQQDNNTIWVLTDTSNVGNSNGWTQIQLGSVDSNLPSGVVSGSDQVLGGTGILSSSNENFTDFSSSIDSRLDNVEVFTSSIDSTIKTKLDTEGVISGSDQILGGSGIVSGSDQLTGSLVDLTSDQTISGTKTFNDIVVNGTGSFAYITSVDGTAKIIGDSYIVLNNDTPTQRYAGIAVYDSGSATPTTASFNFDGQTNDWFYEYSASTVDYGVVLFGPEYNTKGNPTYLTANRIPKAEGTHHLNDSNISDDGSTITLNSNVQVNGNISVTGNVDGIDLQLFSSSVDGRLDTLEGETHENPLSFSDTTKIDFTRVGDTITATVIGGVVSGSGQLTDMTGDVTVNSSGVSSITANSIVNADINTSAGIVYTKLNLQGSGIVSGAAQIDTLGFLQVNGDGVVSGSTQITKTLQEVTTAGNTTDTTISITNGTASTSKTTGALVITGGIGTSGDIFAGGDVVAYASSDIRLKNEITPIQNPLQKINQIGGYSFEWNEEKQHIYSGKDYGVIAQEIEEILPELVETRENGYKAVKYEKLVSLLIEGIKDLSKQVEDLKEKINKG